MNNFMSSLGRLNWRDLGKTVLITVIALFLNWLNTNLLNIQFSNDPVTNQGIVGTVSFAIAYILKQLGTDNQGNVLGIGSK